MNHANLDYELITLFSTAFVLLLLAVIAAAFFLARCILHFKIKKAKKMVLKKIKRQYRLNAFNMMKGIFLSMRKNLKENDPDFFSEIQELRASIDSIDLFGSRFWNEIMLSIEMLNEIAKKYLPQESLAYETMQDIFIKIENCKNCLKAIEQEVNSSDNTLEELTEYLVEHYPGDSKDPYHTKDLVSQVELELDRFFLPASKKDLKIRPFAKKQNK